MREALRIADVAVGNEDEGRPPARPTWSSWSASAARAACSPAHRGDRGRPAAPIEVVNGLGAGDAFGGALVTGCWRTRPERTIRLANAAGAIVAAGSPARTRCPLPNRLYEDRCLRSHGAAYSWRKRTRSTPAATR